MKILLGISLHLLLINGAQLNSKNDNEHRIINGVKVNIQAVPYVVSIRINYKAGFQGLCGGALIGPQLILTAGHCFRNKKANRSWKEAFVRAGSNYHNLEGSVHQVEKVYFHPSSNRFGHPLQYDLAIARVKEPFEYDYHVQPAKVADIGPDNGEKVLILGWGKSKPDWKAPGRHWKHWKNALEAADHLYATNITVRHKKACRTHSTFFIYSFIVNDNIVCIRDFDNSRRSVCFGDSGSPVIYNGRLVGIVNGFLGLRRPKFEIVNNEKEQTVKWGIQGARCTDPFSVPVYTSTLGEKDWINRVLNGTQPDEEQLVPQSSIVASYYERLRYLIKFIFG